MQSRILCLLSAALVTSPITAQERQDKVSYYEFGALKVRIKPEDMGTLGIATPLRSNPSDSNSKSLMIIKVADQYFLLKTLDELGDRQDRGPFKNDQLYKIDAKNLDTSLIKMVNDEYVAYGKTVGELQRQLQDAENEIRTTVSQEKITPLRKRPGASDTIQRTPAQIEEEVGKRLAPIEAGLEKQFKDAQQKISFYTVKDGNLVLGAESKVILKDYIAMLSDPAAKGKPNFSPISETQVAKSAQKLDEDDELSLIHHFKFGSTEVNVDTEKLNEKGHIFPLSFASDKEMEPSIDLLLLEIDGKNYLLKPKMDLNKRLDFVVSQGSSFSLREGDELYALESKNLNLANIKKVKDELTSLIKEAENAERTFEQITNKIKAEIEADKSIPQNKRDEEFEKRSTAALIEYQNSISAKTATVNNFASVKDGNLFFRSTGAPILQGYEELLKNPSARGEPQYYTEEMIENEAAEQIKRMEQAQKFAPAKYQIGHQFSKKFAEDFDMTKSISLISSNKTSGILQTNTYDLAQNQIKRPDGKIEKLIQLQLAKDQKLSDIPAADRLKYFPTQRQMTQIMSREINDAFDLLHSIEVNSTNRTTKLLGSTKFNFHNNQIVDPSGSTQTIKQEEPPAADLTK